MARGEVDMCVGSRFITKEGFQTSAMRRAGIRLLSGLIRLLCGVRVLDVTSGFRATGRRLTEFFARNYAQDYPEPEAIISAVLNGFRVGEAPVVMAERMGGTSSISPLRSVYYMVKVSIALVVYRLTRRARKGGRHMNVPNINLALRLDMFLGAVVFLVVILWLLKKGRLTVRYSIIWLMAGGALLVFAVFPYIVLVLRDWLNMEMPVNVIFTLVLAFVLCCCSAFPPSCLALQKSSSALRRKTPCWKSACASWSRPLHSAWMGPAKRNNAVRQAVFGTARLRRANLV